jgi:hypothetical protein
MPEHGTLPDHYGVLQVDPEASLAVIEAAFRREARRWHPDANPDPTAGARMAALNQAREVLTDPVRRAEYDRQRMAVRTPTPRLDPASVDFSVLGRGQGQTFTIRLLNDGGPPATVRIYPEGGPFWVLASVRGGTAPGEVADFDLEPRLGLGLSPGPQHSLLRVQLDDQAADLALTAWVPAAAQSGAQGEPQARPWSTAPHRGKRAGVGLLAAVMAIGAVAAWPAFPGHSLLSRLERDARSIVGTGPNGGRAPSPRTTPRAGHRPAGGSRADGPPAGGPPPAGPLGGGP